MQAVVLVLIAAVTSPWALPEGENAVPPRTADAAVDDTAVISEHRAQLDRSTRRQPAPTAPAPTTRAPTTRAMVNPHRTRDGVRPADHQQQPVATGNVRLAQFVEGDAWPTAGAARAANSPAASASRRGGPQTPDLLGDGRGEDPYTPTTPPRYVTKSDTGWWCVDKSTGSLIVGLSFWSQAITEIFIKRMFADELGLYAYRRESTNRVNPADASIGL